MPITREELEGREHFCIAPFAQRSEDTRGRVHKEEPPQWRTEFQRDRDRIIHSRAFRRLEYKTQVFLNGTGDHLRTRLTHTMEVAAISRNIARALRLNEDLAESIALAHDLGHSPFGHTGEHALNRLMRAHGGFDHNRQSLRIVEFLERKYPDFPGLNLSFEVREGLAKHGPAGLSPAPGRRPSLEAQVADLADEIAYYSHDLDDGLDAGLLDEAKLGRGVAVWATAAEKVSRRFGVLPEESRRYYTIRQIIDDQVIDVVNTTEAAVRAAGVVSADDVRNSRRRLVGYSAGRRRENLALRRYLYKNLYYNPVVNRPNREAARLLSEVFKRFVDDPSLMGKGPAARVAEDGVHRAVCDYVSGMTDRFCLQEFERLFGIRPALAPLGPIWG
jgi:dGTPase